MRRYLFKNLPCRRDEPLWFVQRLGRIFGNGGMVRGVGWRGSYGTHMSESNKRRQGAKKADERQTERWQGF